MCGLEAYADASVGSLGVELRKRTTIGVELAAKVSLVPSILVTQPHDVPSRNCSFSWMNRRQGWIHRVLGVLWHSSEALLTTAKRFYARA
jgi:hypothetical protein